MKASIVVSLSFILLAGCKNTVSFTSADKKESGSADGASSSTVASGQTSVKVTPASNITHLTQVNGHGHAQLAFRKN